MMPSNMISISIGSVSVVALFLRSESRNLFRQSDLAVHLLGNGFDLRLDVGRIGTLWGIMLHYIIPPFFLSQAICAGTCEEKLVVI
jgi:hypothetical protein